MGYTLNILERPAELTSMEIPGVMRETCVAWDAWSKSHVVEQIDAGV